MVIFLTPLRQPVSVNRHTVNSQAPVTPKLATRGVFRLSRLSVSSYSKRVKKYTPQIAYRGFFKTVNFYARRLWNPQNGLENFRLRFYLLWTIIYGIYLLCIFGVHLNRFPFNNSKTNFKTIIVIQN